MDARDIPLGDIIDGLTARIYELARRLAPSEGFVDGDEWVALNPTRADRRPGSFRIIISGPRAGQWRDFAVDQSGDALNLVSYILFGRSRPPSRNAVEWAKTWLGLDGRDPSQLKETRAAIQKRAAGEEERERLAAGKAAAITRIAKQIFFYQAREHVLDTPADLYLRGRGADLRSLGAQPRCIRFHPGLTHKETEVRKPAPLPGFPGRTVIDFERSPVYPAMVHAIAGEGDGCIAIHRTYLEPDGRGGWRKLSAVQKPKLALGAYEGGMIRLWKGQTAEGKAGAPWGKMPEGEPIAVAEGVEDGWTVACADPSMRVVAGVSLSNLANIVWPAAIGTVTWIDQNDFTADMSAKEREQMANAKRRVAAAWLEQGKRVRRSAPPAGIKDVNDLRRGRAA